MDRVVDREKRDRGGGGRVEMREKKSKICEEKEII